MWRIGITRRLGTSRLGVSVPVPMVGMRSTMAITAVPHLLCSWQLTILLDFAADGEGGRNGEEVSAFFNPIVVVAETEMEIRCNVGADFVTDA